MGRGGGCLTGIVAFGVTVASGIGIYSGYSGYEQAKAGNCRGEDSYSCKFGRAINAALNAESDKPASKKKAASNKTASPTPPAEATDAERLSCAEKLPLATVAGQLVVASTLAADMETVAPLYKKLHIGGVILMTEPKDPADGSIKAFKKSFGPYQPIISTDQEGGLVQRFTFAGELPAAAGVPGRYSAEEYQTLITKNGKQLHKIGIDQTYGTVAERASPALNSRAFSAKESVVASYADASAKGWLAAGITPTLKHFPSVGSQNTDFGSSTTRKIEELRKNDYDPFLKPAVGASVMVANAAVPGLSDGKPASLSEAAITGELREKVGFNGLVVTDSLLADAITADYSPADAAVAAIKAGADQAVFAVATDPKDNQAERDALPKITAALVAAIKDGSIDREQVNASIVRISRAQAVGICG